MTTLPTVFVFTCSNSGYIGLSTQADGANLPAHAEFRHKWTAVKAVTMSELGLEPFVKDARTAIANLTVRGYHLTRITAELIDFPHAHRHSA